MVEHVFINKLGSTVGAYEVRGNGHPGIAASIAHAANVWTRIWLTVTFDWLSEAGEYLEIRLDPSNTLAGTLHPIVTGKQIGRAHV